MAPYQNQKPFVSKMNAIANFDTALIHLHLQITNAGLENVAQDVLHNVNRIFVRTNINFGNNGKAAFALKIGDAGPENKVWACDNDSVVMAIWKNENHSVKIWSSNKDQVKVSRTITWPSTLRNDLHTLLDPKIQALVLYDIIRWIEFNKMAHIGNIRNVIFPNADYLIAALCEYGQPKIFRAFPLTVQVADRSRRDCSRSIAHIPMHQAEGSPEKNLLISVASPPKEDSHTAFERIDMSRDHTLEEGEITKYEIVTSNEAKMEPENQPKSWEEGYSALDHEGFPNNEAETDCDGGCEHEDEKDNSPDREATEFSDEPEQHGSPVFQSRVNSANGVATLQVLGFAVGKELIVHLPDITAFHFSKQHIEDFYPVRLQIGVCDDSRIGTLSYL
jgi:hypothetical protein